MKKEIKIGVTYTGTDEKHSNYVQWLKGNEHIEIITLSPLHTELDSIHNFDGIVLSGGIDTHPKFYNNSITDYPNAPQHFNEKRDEFEIAVFEISQQNSIPLLAICRGMQLVNCILGGNLKQDIGTISNAIHRFDQQDKAHGINIVTGSLLHEITGIERTVINSAHHQAIDIVGKGLVINCSADDGTVEGIEWQDKDNKSFFLGVQWHPERMYKFHLNDSPATKSIRDIFINAIKNKIATQLKNV